jgi:phosphate transport system substrate-binding protein
MNRSLYLLAAAAACLLSIAKPVNVLAADQFTGAGSSAAAPVYRAWTSEYARTGGAGLDYQAVGSGEGIKRISAHQVDFGASDVAPAQDMLDRSGLLLVPTFVTGAVPVINLPRIASNQLRLTGDVLARIYAGEITRWNALEISEINPGLALPDMAIKLVVRADGSGTTYYFSDYLSSVSPGFASRFGRGTTIKWVEGTVTAVKGSDGVVAAVKSLPGAIGYVDFNYVADKGLTPVRMQSRDGQFVDASPATFREALLNSDWFARGDFHSQLVNRPGKLSWPITMGTFVLMPRVVESRDGSTPALRFFVWALLNGDKLVGSMNFVPLPDKVQALAYKNLSAMIDRNGAPIGMNALAGAMGAH